MPFDPLPRIFVEELQSLDPRRAAVVDLGCGSGAFGALMSAHGVRPFGLELRSWDSASAADVVGQARSAPFAAGSLRLVVAANLVRHLVPGDRRWAFLGHWVSLLDRDGALYVFEDMPQASPAACGNFKRMQHFLSRLMPESRGPLLRPDQLARHRRAGCGWRISNRGRESNRQTLDAAAALDLLCGDGHPADGEVEDLARDIRRDGLVTGGYWWCRIECDPATDAGPGAEGT